METGSVHCSGHKTGCDKFTGTVGYEAPTETGIPLYLNKLSNEINVLYIPSLLLTYLHKFLCKMS